MRPPNSQSDYRLHCRPRIWVQTSEGAKFWAGVLAELRNRGVKDVLSQSQTAECAIRQSERICQRQSKTDQWSASDSQSGLSSGENVWGRLFLVGTVVAEHGPEHVDASSGEGQDRPGVAACLGGSFAVVWGFKPGCAGR
jgi:hypothetical protein